MLQCSQVGLSSSMGIFFWRSLDKICTLNKPTIIGPAREELKMNIGLRWPKQGLATSKKHRNDSDGYCVNEIGHEKTLDSEAAVDIEVPQALG